MTAPLASLSAQDELFLRRAITLAQEAVQHGNHPFGCVIVARRRAGGEDAALSAEIVVESENTVHTLHDPTGHAETNAIRKFGEWLHKAQVDGNVSKDEYSFELFTSTEPCAMCCGAIYWSFSIHRVVYACSEQGLAKHAGDDFLIPCREIFEHGKQQRIVIEGPFLEAEAEKLHEAYWPTLFSSS